MDSGPVVQIIGDHGAGSYWLVATQIAANIGTALAAVGAIVAVFFISLRTIDSQWNESFRKLYDEFWTSEAIAKARAIISYQDEYDKIKRTLEKMAMESWPDRSMEPRDIRKGLFQIIVKSDRYSKYDIEATECIDQFCSKLMQLTFVRDIEFINKRQAYFRYVFLNYWGKAIDNRKELKKYIARLWPTLMGQLYRHKFKRRNLLRYRKTRRKWLSKYRRFSRFYRLSVYNFGFPKIEIAVAIMPGSDTCAADLKLEVDLMPLDRAASRFSIFENSLENGNLFRRENMKILLISYGNIT